jgi:hypothetical protein
MTQQHKQYPLFEWCTTFMMIGMAVCIFLTPKTIELGAFRFMTYFGMSSLPAFALLFIAGTLRICALIANGRWQYGSLARLSGAILGAFFWFQLGVALVLLTQVSGTLSIGIPVYFVLMGGEIYSCYRIGLEAGAVRCPIDKVAGADHARPDLSR